jgi:hypothetical protein
MAVRSFADVPNRTVRLFLERVGKQYDLNRGHHPPYTDLTPELIDRFGGRCAYCGEPPPSNGLREEHLVPINRESCGLHAWGNVVPACNECNKVKRHHPWQDHPRLDAGRRAAIEAFIAEYGYNPNVTELRAVLANLYDLVDEQTRALVQFAIVASQPYIDGLSTSTMTVVEAPPVAKPALRSQTW